MSEATSSLMGLYKGTGIKRSNQYLGIDSFDERIPSVLKSSDYLLLAKIISFEKEIRNAENAKQVFHHLIDAAKKIVPTKEAALLFIDEETGQLKSEKISQDNELVEMLNKYYKEGVINFVFESKRPTLVPELESYNSSPAPMNFILFPIFENDKKKGLFAVLTSLNKNSLTEDEKEALNLIVNITLGKIEKIKLLQDLFGAYEEAQAYQAKLSNDYRLIEIGKLTEGIVEDIISPLQVILSQVELLKEHEENLDGINKIKKQVDKINGVISRLVKFADVNRKALKISSFNLNQILNDYYNLVKSTLDTLKLECVLDLGKNIPTMLTHPDYIYQLLTNLIGLIDHKPGRKSGVILQTRYNAGIISLNLIATQSLKLENRKNSFELNMKIIENIAAKHSGKIKIDNSKESGCSISIKFPLKTDFEKK
ncbi:MAG: hypothetical protein K8F36_03250 [Melioribacteraceae bacterium]|nr:hypothetical protein [Melioribacteraceae bacterium]